MKRTATAKPISLWKKILRIAACTLVLLILSDITGALICTIVDILAEIIVDYQGAALIYVIWFVLGIFTGLFIFTYSGGFAHPEIANPISWLDHPGAQSTGTVVCLISLPILIAVCALASMAGGSSDSVYVPGNTPLTITFFVAISIGLIGSRFTFGNDKAQRAVS